MGLFFLFFFFWGVGAEFRLRWEGGGGWGLEDGIAMIFLIIYTFELISSYLIQIQFI